MKKTIFLLVAIATLFASCTNGPKKADLISQNDSLRSVLASRDAAMDEMINTINVVEQGFKAINEAQGRINLDAAAEQSKLVTLQKDINFINETLQKNKQQIAELEEKLSKNQSYSKQLKTMVEKLKKELAEKNEQIAALQQELSQKNIHIEELDKSVQQLTGSVDELSATKAANEKIISAQDNALNTVWYAIGTKSELKEQKILDGKKVLRDAAANMSYFTKCDRRELKTIETHEKNAKLLTTHPEGSYKLERNSEKKYVLTITDADNFWSVSKYLVIQVR
jgi:chromosome segregation ATPase